MSSAEVHSGVVPGVEGVPPPAPPNGAPDAAAVPADDKLAKESYALAVEGEKRDGSPPPSEEDSREIFWTAEEERRVVRRVDLAIIPWMTFIYVCSQIDRVNLGNAAIMNLETPESTLKYQLGLEGNQYNVAVSVFFIGYVLAELPSNLTLMKVRPSVHIARICVTWGICATLMAATFNFGSLVACRFFLGLFEGGLAPGIIFYLGFWYKKHERGSRWAIIYVGAGIAGSLGGIIAYAVANMNGALGLAGWRWLFILEGVPTVLAGIASFWLIPDYPTTCKFLQGRELEIQLARLPPNAPTQHTLRFDKKQLFDSMKNVQMWIFCFASLCLISALYAGAYFIPTIIAAMGFKSYTAQLLNVGLQLTGACYNLAINFVSDNVRERGWLIVGTLVLPIVGWVLLATIQQNLSPNTNYGLLYLTCIATAAVPILFTYAVQNVQGATKAASVSAMVVSSGSIGGIVGAYIYLPQDAPLYKTGHAVNAALYVATVASVLVIKAMNRWAPHAAVEANVVAE
ncbi:major facilitator superfamily domain-containing protein [Hyaloraphidium curvatum]|nr:major facilitator superfamily domain-containing protein [Hyaloraphidium curvatum]